MGLLLMKPARVLLSYTGPNIHLPEGLKSAALKTKPFYRRCHLTHELAGNKPQVGRGTVALALQPGSWANM
jgi:hypothetical protein